MSAGWRRRDVLRTGLIAGVSVVVSPLMRPASASLSEEDRARPLAWDPVARRPLYRMDGIAKVTGEKLFARDHRAADLPGWPSRQGHALVLRVARADCVYEGFDLSALDAELWPDRSITAAQLERDGITLPQFYGDEMLLAEGRTPAHLGHPVALLLWHDFARYRLAKTWLRAHPEVLRYGEQTGPRARDPWGATRIVRVAGPTPDAPDIHSTFEHGMLFASAYTEGRPLWPDADAKGDAAAHAMHHAAEIERSLEEPPRGSRSFARSYFSQSTDTCAFEPDNANGWYDPETRTLHLVVASQSPQEVAEEAALLVSRSRFRVGRLQLHPCYTVGYGSKDHHALPFYGAVAALYGDGVPIQLANDREEQFQSGLKRHSFRIAYRVSIDTESCTFRALQGVLDADGGGRANFSPSVALVAATSAQSIYAFPKNDLVACARASRAVDAGSARGYGTLQSMSAMEMLVDELAAELKLDPIELRLRNVLQSGMKNSQGAIPAGAVRAQEVLERARAHPLWRQRETRKTEHDARHADTLYGVGFACAHKDFGTGAEAAFAGVEISAAGRIEVRHIAVEIGTGMTTTQAALCAEWFGRPADHVHSAQTEWPELPMVTSGNPWAISDAEQSRAAQNPLWTPHLATPTSASNSAFYYGHATREAARLVFERGLWPAALEIWSRGVGGGSAAPLVIRREDARWVEGKLTAAGLPPLTLEALAAHAHAQGKVTGAVVHTFNRWQWAEAELDLDGERMRLPIDGLALRDGAGSYPAAPSHASDGSDSPARTPKPPNSAAQRGYRVVPRTRAFFPPAQRNGAGTVYYSTVGTLVELRVHPSTGRVEILSHHSILECGKALVPELISGQIQGGVAMGIGHALYEELPLYEGGPGDGTWNLDRYHLPRASEVAVFGQSAEILPPLSDSDPPKGMAEVTAIPVIAAIVNAIAHATGRRFRELPVTPLKLREALA